MAFDPDKYLEKNKGGFDPDAYLAKQEAPKAPPSRAAQTALESFGNTALLGNLPQVQAAVGGLMPNPGLKVDEKLMKEGFTISKPTEGYIERRDENIKRQASQRKENPNAALAGDIAGVVGSAAIPLGAGRVAQGMGFALKPPVGLAAKVGRAAIGGGAAGAIANPGDVEGEVSLLQLESRASNALTGALIGGATGAAAEAIGAGATKAAGYFKGKVGEKAAGAIGATTADRKKLGELGVNKIGQDARDMGVVGAFTTPKSAAKAAGAIREDVGDEIGNLIKSADSAGAPKVDGAKIGVELLDDVDVVASRKTPGSEGMYESAVKHAETLASSGELTLQEAHKLRRGIDKSINFNKKRMDLKPGEMEVLYKIRDKINGALNDAVNTVQGKAADALKLANAKYSKLSRIGDMAEKRSAMNSANRTVSLTDTISGGAAANVGAAVAGAPGAAVAGLVGAGVNKFGRTFGKGIQAVGFEKAANVASKIPGFSGAVATNPEATQAVIASINELGKGNKFERSRFDKILNNPELIDMFKSDPGLVESIDDPMLRAQVRKKLGVRAPSSEPKQNESAFERRLKAK